MKDVAVVLSCMSLLRVAAVIGIAPFSGRLAFRVAAQSLFSSQPDRSRPAAYAFLDGVTPVRRQEIRLERGPHELRRDRIFEIDCDERRLLRGRLNLDLPSPGVGQLGFQSGQRRLRICNRHDTSTLP
jgi:hypothetical protein